MASALQEAMTPANLFSTARVEKVLSSSSEALDTNVSVGEVREEQLQSVVLSRITQQESRDGRRNVTWIICNKYVIKPSEFYIVQKL